MNLVGETGSAGGAGIGASINSPAHTPMTVGAVGFGANWTMEDSMAASIIRLEQENQELRAANAVGEQERSILVREMQRLRERIADMEAARLKDGDEYVQLTAKGRALLEGLR